VFVIALAKDEALMVKMGNAWSDEFFDAGA
jgi:hypothetical protein